MSVHLSAAAQEYIYINFQEEKKRCEMVKKWEFRFLTTKQYLEEKVAFFSVLTVEYFLEYLSDIFVEKLKFILNAEGLQIEGQPGITTPSQIILHSYKKEKKVHYLRLVLPGGNKYEKDKVPEYALEGEIISILEEEEFAKYIHPSTLFFVST